jgi:hypothetical protein
VLVGEQKSFVKSRNFVVRKGTRFFLGKKRRGDLLIMMDIIIYEIKRLQVKTIGLHKFLKFITHKYHNNINRCPSNVLAWERLLDYMIMKHQLSHYTRDNCRIIKVEQKLIDDYNLKYNLKDAIVYKYAEDIK